MSPYYIILHLLGEDGLVHQASFDANMTPEHVNDWKNWWFATYCGTLRVQHHTYEPVNCICCLGGTP
jgi:hypothetical protein